METRMAWNRAIALLSVRLIIGMLSFFLAYHKIFVTGLDQEMQWFADLRAWFPEWILVAVNHYAAFVELVGGFLLCIGWKRDFSAYAILSVLVIVTFGHSLEKEVWDIQQLVFRLAMLAAIMILPEDWDIIRLDRWRQAIGRGEPV